MRSIIGIDLGTTNSCVAYVDTEQPRLAIQSLRIPQLIMAGYVEPCATLPSFCYLPAKEEFPPKSLALPWKQDCNFIIGTLAREQGAKVPTRLVQSAKSWLCHSAVNRREAILPFEAADESQRISPLEATSRYLSHIKESWNHLMAQGRPELEFEQQEVILTVPASFDEMARALTIEAAKKAGFLQMTLLEEPQAAFYCWLSDHEEVFQKQFEAGNIILVCDVGGGTTDFSLIEVVSKEGLLGFQRMSVGDHLLLGGDNMDVALAHYIESKLKNLGHELTSLQWQQLLHQARRAKESQDPLFKIILHGTSSSVVGGTLTMDISKEEREKLLLEGFFGSYSWTEALKIRKTIGLRTMGLPYEEEPSIIKHLAKFLAESEGLMKPDYVLFNGGSMKPKLFQEAIIKSLGEWFPEKKPQMLVSKSLDLSVARGAAYYGKVRRGLGVKIGGGSARSYYLEITTQDASGQELEKALTIFPRGTEEGASFETSQTFFLTPNQPVSFQLYSSHIRLHDAFGQLVAIDQAEMHPLPTLQTVLRYGKKENEKIPVKLRIRSTSLGALELFLQSVKTDHQWLLEFQLKMASGQENSLASLEKTRADVTFDMNYLKEAEKLLSASFSAEKRPEKLMEQLEEVIQLPRREWPISILRSLWEPLLKQAGLRKRSIEFEARWWNLAGFLLRPGFGYPLDDFRIKELWKVILGDLKSSKSAEVQIQQWICFRRIAGGLSKGQQMQLASEIFPYVNAFKGKTDLYQYSEQIRTLASFELLEMAQKIKLGNQILHRIKSKSASKADFWALGRLGARHLLYGSAVNVIPREICASWIKSLLEHPPIDQEQKFYLFSQLARKTDHRELNLPENLLQEVLEVLKDHPQITQLTELFFKDVALLPLEKEQLFGEKLPPGLLLQDLY